MDMKEQHLRNITKHYWECEQGLDERLKWYITHPHEKLGNKSLLEAELAAAERRENLKAEPCKTLVLLVGHSLEPLLQSVCVYKPSRVVFLLNEDGYGDEEWYEFARHLTEAVGHLAEKGLLDGMPEFPGKGDDQGYPVKDEPHAVFQKLVEVLKDETEVVIDVTGGKKSMVSGAYMYAAYAGTRISYVDFDEYDSEYRRPYGYTCKIDGLSNPYEAFALRQWEQVRALYKRYQFREARLLLVGHQQDKPQYLQKPILEHMKEYLPGSETSIKQLEQILECYELWDAGLYNESAQKVKEIQEQISSFEPPTTVTRLGGKWFTTEQAHFKGAPPNFYEDTPELRAYVLDELARIQRLIDNEDYRSAFLRAGSLNEIVMLARLVKLVTNQEQRTRLLTALQSKTPSAQSVFKYLSKPAGISFTVGRGGADIFISSFEGEVITVTVEKEMTWWQNVNLFDGHGSWQEFIQRRNDLAHKYYSPPRPWAEDALAFVRANVEDFWEPIEDINVHTEALSWPELCKLTGVAGFLPPNLRKEA